MQDAKFLPIEIQKSTSGADARFVMSAATPDRVRDTIDPTAYKALKVSKLIALWQHDQDKPIGWWENLKADGDKLVGDLKLAGTALAQMVKQLIADGVPLGASIGFRGKGEPNKAGGVHFKEIELLETSIVSVPAHPRAFQIAKNFGLTSVIDGEPKIVAVSGDSIRNAKAAILSANRTLRN